MLVDIVTAQHRHMSKYKSGLKNGQGTKGREKAMYKDEELAPAVSKPEGTVH